MCWLATTFFPKFDTFTFTRQCCPFGALFVKSTFPFFYICTYLARLSTRGRGMSMLWLRSSFSPLLHSTRIPLTPHTALCRHCQAVTIIVMSKVAFCLIIWKGMKYNLIYCFSTGALEVTISYHSFPRFSLCPPYRATTVAPSHINMINVREAPPKKLHTLFGHCPNSYRPPPPSLKRALWGTLFPGRMQQMPLEL